MTRAREKLRASDTERYYNGEQTEEDSGTLNDKGQLQITIPTDFTETNHTDTTYRIEARVTDEANREISGHNYVVATYSSFRIAAWPASYLYEVGSTAKLQVEARDYDGRPVRTAFHVSLQSWDYRSRTGEDFFTTDGQTDANGNAEIEIPIKKGGSLHATVTAVTPENRTLQETAYIWVPDKEWYWWGAEQERIQIIPDQKAYKPGDTAKVMIMAGQDPVSILVTSEGVGLLNRQVVRSQGGPVMVEVPIRAENRAELLRHRDLSKRRQTSQRLQEPCCARRCVQAQRAIAASKPQFQPGEAASYTIIAKDAQGKPASAEFSVGVVDEAIYAIRPEADD